MKTVDVPLGDGTVAQITKPERDDFPANLGGAVQYALANVIIWIAETSGEAFGAFGGSALISFLERIEPHLVEYYSPLIEEIKNIDGIPAWYGTFLDKIQYPESEAGVAVAQAVLGTAAGGITGSLLGVLLSPLTYGANDLIRPARPVLPDLVAMDWRNVLDDATIVDWLADQGWPSKAIKAYRELLRPRLSTPDLLSWAWRVKHDPTAVMDELTRRGYDEDEIGKLVDISRRLLSVSDLLAWSWRVNKDPETVKQEIIAQGYSETDADRFIELSRQRLGVADLLNWSWRVNREPEAVRDELIALGYPEKQVDRLIELSKNRLSPSDLVAWAWRVEKDPKELKDEIIAQGYPDEQADRILKLAEFIPGVGDLISMAVREAWRDDVAAAYGYDEDYPTEFEDWAKKQGMRPEWARRYWRAHWNLPGPTMAREMLWRTSMTEDDYKTLLRIADYPRAFRDWMTEIAYTPFTRVDVRRMHKLGVVSDDELVRAYKDLGYNDEKAAAMAQFTILYNMETELEYTKSELLKGYRLGMLSRAEASEHLVGLGNSPQYAGYLLDLEDYKRLNAEISERLKHIKTLYIAGEIDRTAATSRLGRLDLEADRIARYLDMWTIAREAKTARPTRAMIEEYYKDGIITEEVGRQELRKRHYQDYVIDWMIEDWDQQIVEAARKEAERAQAEQERMAKAEFKTSRSMALANLNREIAELKVLIAEWKVAMYLTDDEEQLATLKETTLEAKAKITRLQLEKARLPVVPEEAR